MNFYLGAHHPDWLNKVHFPLFVSRRRLVRYKKYPVANGPWALDSGGFTELSMYGQWTVRMRQYIEEVRRFRDEVGNLEWAAPQDWMCEPFIIAKTRASVQVHQRRTVRNYVALMEAASDCPWVPVIQGYTRDEYMRCIDLYSLYRVDLTKLPRVGIGSICRRQAEQEIASLIQELAGMRIKLHAFGVKLRGLRLCADSLVSADSMAWSYDARRMNGPTCGSTTHKNCANCIIYATAWREKVLAVAREGFTREAVCEVQGNLFPGFPDCGVLPGLPLEVLPGKTCKVEQLQTGLEAAEKVKTARISG